MEDGSSARTHLVQQAQVAGLFGHAGLVVGKDGVDSRQHVGAEHGSSVAARAPGRLGGIRFGTPLGRILGEVTRIEFDHAIAENGPAGSCAVVGKLAVAHGERNAATAHRARVGGAGVVLIAFRQFAFVRSGCLKPVAVHQYTAAPVVGVGIGD